MYKEVYTIVQEMSNVGASREISGVFVGELDKLGKTGLKYNIDWVESTFTVLLGDYEVLSNIDKKQLEDFFSGDDYFELAVKWVNIDNSLKKIIKRIFSGTRLSMDCVWESLGKELIQEAFETVQKRGYEKEVDIEKAIMEVILERLS